MTQEEKQWREKNSADEQLSLVSTWCDYEDYDIIDKCKTMERVIELYLFIQFEVGVEFVSSVNDLIDEELEDGDITTLGKALAWDKAHDTQFFSTPELADHYTRESLRHKISALLMDTAEDNPFVCNITIAESKAQGLSTLELPRVVGAFQDYETRIWFNLYGYSEPMNFDDLPTEDLTKIWEELTNN